MARAKIVLDGSREQIAQWARDGLRKEEIHRRLNEQKIEIGLSTLSTQLRVWGIKFNRSPIKKTDALRDRVKELFHTCPKMRDEEMVRRLQHEGFQISGTRALARLRKECGLYKRVEKDQEEKIKVEVIEALRREFGDNFELPDDLATRNLSDYLRSKYNLVGRDRIRRIAAEINPEWVQRRKEKGRFPRAASSSPEQDDENMEQSLPTEARMLSSGYTDASPAMSDNAVNEISRLSEMSHAQHSASRTAASPRVSYNSAPHAHIFNMVPSWLDPSLLESG